MVRRSAPTLSPFSARSAPAFYAVSTHRRHNCEHPGWCVIGESDSEDRYMRCGFLRLLLHPLGQGVLVFASRQSESGASQTSGIDRESLDALQSPATLRALI